MSYLENLAIEALIDTADRLKAEVERVGANGLSEETFRRTQFAILALELRLNDIKRMMWHERKTKLVASFNDRLGRHGEAAQALPG